MAPERSGRSPYLGCAVVNRARCDWSPVTRTMTELKRIVLAEDNPNDVELTLSALSQINLANEVVVVRDGAEALDYLFRRNAYADRSPGRPAVLLLDLKMPKIDGLDVLRAVKA